ncbi:glycosyltransferase [Polaribacter sp. ALD11]|uniref:glycosyltransferase family 2 protein n=1 Tax=Polaribacter sp. ALD11 TaxID=2058137 RepID=UPI000C311BCB|nr:glycosyltransferase [Polaribacter sp. ALD11]AUC86277.1 glycosyltransferase [Polaribacter sp. ALD11]
MIWILIFLFSSYTILIISLAIGFLKMDEFKPESKIPKTSFSVIIPFRNEVKNLLGLLNSILALEYPKELVTFIFVDDASSDGSTELIKKFKSVISNEKRREILERKQVLDTISKNSEITQTDICIISNNRTSNSPKKDAISTAVAIAKNNWIVTTDADCILPQKWLSTLDAFIQKNSPKMVVAPVNYIVNNTSLEQFQLLDFMSLQGTTIGSFGINSPFLCNGANLAYKKETFLKLNGFVGNNNIASGDDIFLFEKFIEHDKKGVQFLKSKDAIVSTFPVKTIKNLIHQRVRWASKTSKFKSTKVKLIGLLVFLINISVILSVFLSNNILVILLPLLLKTAIDLFLFIPTMFFYNHKKSFLKWYIFSSILYPFFSVFIVFKSLFSEYSWKGRTFKK